jgi:folate-binding protein YgfZ
MTELVNAANLAPTPLAMLLGTIAKEQKTAPQPASSPLTAYRGVLTPLLLDAKEREMEALVRGAAVHDLGWMRRVAVRGADRFRWLNGMVSNTVTGLDANSGAWNLVMNAAGRIQGELYVWREGAGIDTDALELEIAADQVDKLLAHFDRFIIMDDVQLTQLAAGVAGEPGGVTAVGLIGPMSDSLLERVGLPTLPEPLTSGRAEWRGRAVRLLRSYGVLAPRYELWVKTEVLQALWTALREAGATPVAAASLESLRIAEGVPAYGTDMVERDLPQETSQTRALHFNKGCYLGQEIVERIRTRGNVHRHLLHLELDGPLPATGTEVKYRKAAGEEAVAGAITSATEVRLEGSARLFALAMISAEAEAHTPQFTYIVNGIAGTGRILTSPPRLDLDPGQALA